MLGEVRKREVSGGFSYAREDPQDPGGLAVNQAKVGFPSGKAFTFRELGNFLEEGPTGPTQGQGQWQGVLLVLCPQLAFSPSTTAVWKFADGESGPDSEPATRVSLKFIATTIVIWFLYSAHLCLEQLLGAEDTRRNKQGSSGAPGPAGQTEGRPDA